MNLVGKNGLVDKFLKDVPWSNRFTIQRVLMRECCKRKERSFKGEYMISRGTVDEQIVADFYEEGYSIEKIWRIMNQRREDIGELVGRSSIVNTIRRLKALKIPVRSMPQGSSDCNSDWA